MSTPPPRDPHRLRRMTLLVMGVTLGVAIITGLILALLFNIADRRREAEQPFFRVAQLDDSVEDPAIWGQNFPLQFEAYRRTVDQTRTRYGGSEAMARTPDARDPRPVVAQSRLQEEPRLRTMWAGYPFAEDFREDRGHAHMLSDQIYTRRQEIAKQPGTCLHCHASVYVPYKEAGDGDLMKGFERLNQMSFQEASLLVEHPVACIDCHAPDTMHLRVTRPAFIEGMQALKASQGIKNFDLARDATRQELRTYVCAQCHVEYYFRKTDKRLIYPWQDGLKVEQIMAYYDRVGHRDWTHARSGAPVLKAQHPEFELYSQGIHARSGVACADCHMPFVRAGAMKISDHHVRSPMLDVHRACQTCHPWPASELRQRVETQQTRTYQLRDRAMSALVELIEGIEAASASGAPAARLAAARQLQRRGQFYLDFVEAENSTGFHAPGEALRILGEAIDYTRQGQLALAGIGRPPAPTATP